MTQRTFNRGKNKKYQKSKTTGSALCSNQKWESVHKHWSCNKWSGRQERWCSFSLQLEISGLSHASQVVMQNHSYFTKFRDHQPKYRILLFLRIYNANIPFPSGRYPIASSLATFFLLLRLVAFTGHRQQSHHSKHCMWKTTEGIN